MRFCLILIAMSFYFNKKYFYWFMLLFSIEASIAYFLKDGFIRHTFGDFIVVIMLYCFLKSFMNLKPIVVGLLVFCISFCVEYLQYFQLIKILGLQDNKIANLVLGNTYNILDLLAYIIGISIVMLLESKFSTRSK